MAGSRSHQLVSGQRPSGHTLGLASRTLCLDRPGPSRLGGAGSGLDVSFPSVPLFVPAAAAAPRGVAWGEAEPAGSRLCSAAVPATCGWDALVPRSLATFCTPSAVTTASPVLVFPLTVLSGRAELPLLKIKLPEVFQPLPAPRVPRRCHTSTSLSRRGPTSQNRSWARPPRKRD